MSSSSAPLALGDASLSFRKQCEDDLSPKAVTVYNVHSGLWYVIGITTAVAFTALAAFAFIAASLLAPPIYAPLVAIAAILLIEPVSGCTKQFIKFSEAAATHAKERQSLQKYAQQISLKSALEVRFDLMDRGMDFSTQNLMNR